MNTALDQVQPITVALEKACGEVPPFSLEVRELGCFPNTSRPRVLWVGVHEATSQMMRLQERLERALETLDFPPEKRDFHAHLTLARAARNARPAMLRQVGAWVAEAPPPGLGSMEATHVSLIQSELRPTGAVYTPLAEVPLGG